MAKPEFPLALQLKETCRLTGARWSVCLVRNEAGWDFCALQGLTKTRLAELTRYLQEKTIASWLSGALSSNRVRSRQVGVCSEDLGCQRLFVFPNRSARAVLLVGADRLDKQGEAFFRILALNIPEQLSLKTEVEPMRPETWPATMEIEFEHSFDPQQVWKNVLESLVSTVSCVSAWLAIRSGDVFRIEAVWNLPVFLYNMELSIQTSSTLSHIVTAREGLLLNDIHAQEDSFLQITSQPALNSWLGIPVVIGQRVIGCIGFMAAEPGAYQPADVARLSSQVNRLAYDIENAVVLSEVSHYLQQLALLNELASAASLGANTQEVASRVIQRLRRTFQTERVGVYLFSSTGKELQSFGDSGSDKSSPLLLSSLVQQVVETGLPNRIHEDVLMPVGTPSQTVALSALAVPLKYRGNVIGALALESMEPGAFSQRDEQLLVLISSHLAGLFENMRLSDETRRRAGNLSLIHAVVQQVVGLTDLASIAKKTTEILVKDFSSGLAAVILPGENTACILQASSSHLVMDPFLVGVSSQVFASGASRRIQDVAQDADYQPMPGWQAGSELCVALSEAGHILGVIDVQRSAREAYSENDLVALEALAGVLSSVILGARRYRQLQDSVQQLHAVMEAQRLAENRLVRSARMAAVGELSAGVAHELNNPLTTVSGFVELILEELPPDSLHRPDLELVLHESLRARSVVRRLLDFARPVENQRIPTDLNELARDTLGLVNHLARTGGVQILLDLDESLPHIPLDPGQIKQVLLNLIHNAIQAMPAGGHLSIRSGRAFRDEKDWLTISIQDTGIGIAPKNLERIFEPFFTTRPAGKGTGLGLWVSYGIVAEHGGMLEVESMLAKGTCFTIFLPLNLQANSGELHG